MIGIVHVSVIVIYRPGNGTPFFDALTLLYKITLYELFVSGFLGLDCNAHFCYSGNFFL